jgi:hypothetical protein
MIFKHQMVVVLIIASRDSWSPVCLIARIVHQGPVQGVSHGKSRCGHDVGGGGMWEGAINCPLPTGILHEVW